MCISFIEFFRIIGNFVGKKNFIKIDSYIYLMLEE